MLAQASGRAVPVSFRPEGERYFSFVLQWTARRVFLVGLRWAMRLTSAMGHPVRGARRRRWSIGSCVVQTTGCVPWCAVIHSASGRLWLREGGCTCVAPRGWGGTPRGMFPSRPSVRYVGSF